jgi:hypothetical protein
MDPWKLSDIEWDALKGLLEPGGRATTRPGRPRGGELRSLAEACLFRSYHSLSTGRSHCFN